MGHEGERKGGAWVITSTKWRCWESFRFLRLDWFSPFLSPQPSIWAALGVAAVGVPKPQHRWQQLPGLLALALCAGSALDGNCWWVNWDFNCNCSHTALQTASLFIFNEALCLFFPVPRLLPRVLITYIKCGRRFVHRQVMPKPFGLGLHTQPLGFDSDSPIAV